METIIIYRVENDNGSGPYTRDANMWEMVHEHSTFVHSATPDAAHPNFYTETGLKVRWGDYHGFADAESARVWFADWIEELASRRFNIWRYEVLANRVRFAPKQLVFLRKGATRLDIVPWT